MEPLLQARERHSLQVRMNTPPHLPPRLPGFFGAYFEGKRAAEEAMVAEVHHGLGLGLGLVCVCVCVCVRVRACVRACVCVCV